MVQDDEIGSQDTAITRARHASETQPLLVDAWVASSLLQKAIRRGEVELAVRAGLTLYEFRGKGIWRRLMVIAFEDLPANLTEILEQVALVGSDPLLHEKLGGERSAVVQIIKKMALAPKDRSSDYLASIACHHPSFAPELSKYLGEGTDKQLSRVADENASLEQRCLAAWSVVEAKQPDQTAPKSARVAALFQTCRVIGVPERVIRPAQLAYKRTREFITLLHPLIWTAMSQDEGIQVKRIDLPISPTRRDVPLYAFDKHTRLGKAAIRRFLKENQELRNLVLEYVSPEQALIAVETVAFYADAAPISLRLNWNLSHHLAGLGMEADLFRDGIPVAAAEGVYQAMTRNLVELNAVRSELFSRSR